MPAVIIAGTLSAAGEALQRLPPSEARPWIWVEPISSSASTTPGQACRTSGCSPSSAPLTAAPIRKPPSSAVIIRVSGMCFTSTISSGLIMPARSCTNKSVPPARTRAAPFAAANNATASSIEPGASYRIAFMFSHSVCCDSGRRIGHLVRPPAVATYRLKWPRSCCPGSSGPTASNPVSRIGWIGEPKHDPNRAFPVGSAVGAILAELPARIQGPRCQRRRRQSVYTQVAPKTQRGRACFSRRLGQFRRCRMLII